MSKKTRYTLIIGEKQQATLARVAKEQQLNQGEVLEVLIDEMETMWSVRELELKKYFEAKRASKVETRGRKKDIDKVIETLTPQQRVELIQKLSQGT